MFLEVKKLGRIKEAKLEIKPLTIFVGENNTNKTWLAYLLYGIFQYETIVSILKKAVSDKRMKLNKILTKLFEDFKKNNYEFDFEDFVTNYFDIFWETGADFFIKYEFYRFLNIESPKFFSKSAALLRFDEKEKENILEKFKSLNIDKEFLPRKIELFKEPQSAKVIVNSTNSEPINISQFVYTIGFLIYLSKDRIFQLPAERKGLTPLYKMLTLAEINLSEFITTLLNLSQNKKEIKP